MPIDSDPMIGETPLATLQSWLTPNSLFYVRNHFCAPSEDDAVSELLVDGHVSLSLALSMDDLLDLPRQTHPVTMECAGNNRSDLDPPVPGNPFQNGAISTAIWSGVPLAAVLEQAGVQPGAVEVLFEGVDAGEPEPGANSMTYLRSLPIDVAMHPHTLLAYEMNGEPLSLEHGWPLRLVVPGWYGMASVKWLRRIRVLDEKYEGFFQTDRYIIEGDDGEPTLLSSIYVKSLISWPRAGEALTVGTHNVTGLAWSGRGHIRKVEVSADGGETWSEAQLVGPRHSYAWQQWNYQWTPGATGHYTLAARAEDEEGNVQPMQTRWNRLGYAVNGVKPICVSVE